MKNILQKFKNLNGIDKGLLIITVIIFLLVCTSIYLNISHIMDYSKNRDSGNARWKEVEVIINTQKDKIDKLERLLKENNIEI